MANQNRALASREEGGIRQQGAGDIMFDVVVKGNLKGLSPEQKAHYYIKVCDSLGLNYLTKPFEFIEFQGKEQLYALKGATDQLRDKRNVHLDDLTVQQVGDAYVVTAKVSLPNGRRDQATGVVNVKGLNGESLANAMMKAETKAKRRATLSICGLGWLDESEVDTIPGARKVSVNVEQARRESPKAAPALPEAATAPPADEADADPWSEDYYTGGLPAERADGPGEGDPEPDNPLSDYFSAMAEAESVAAANKLYGGIQALIKRGDLSLTGDEAKGVYEAYDRRLRELKS